ncbi:glutamine--fructose-6-phosphate transaminase (isomerizing) [bacterium]|nr:glutamine--fructose-6-phosphate transaminase (isomerizing) [bacterium]MBU1782557.1 glutamine--fructose-6-phosphate transaminase (isomerizing) [bacterium]
MCGIIGYVGKREAKEVLIEGLRRLEYRGYDSAGISVLNQGEIKTVKTVGKLFRLEEALKESLLSGNIGIGHTRWATHGRPSNENAHPHSDCYNQVVVAHNGIIENYIELREELKNKGHILTSETDTEIIAHLIEEYLKISCFEKAVLLSLKALKGAYAVGVIYNQCPDTIIAARLGSPLIIGLGQEEHFIASDIPAILNHTREVIFLDEEEVAIIKAKEVKVMDLEGKVKLKTSHRVEWNPVLAEKGGYKHFMLKEIHEQPMAIEDTMRGKLKEDDVFLEEINLSEEDINKIDRIFIVACGTSYHAALIGKFMIEELANIPTEVDIGSEFRYRNPIINDKVLFITISQSGETADSIAALREAKKKKAKVISICNVLGSTITRESDGVIYTHAGPEIGVASTKAFTTQIVVLYMLAIYLGRRRKMLSSQEIKELILELRRLPQHVVDVLKSMEEIKNYTKLYFKCSDFLFLGRGINYPIALEGALKLKEISYIHAEGYPAGEMKHGPIALIDENMPVVVIATQSKVYHKTISNIEEVRARDGIVIALANSDDQKIANLANHVTHIPKTSELLSPVLNIIPLQALAYYIADKRGCDVDQPRNLAKSVTVE